MKKRFDSITKIIISTSLVSSAALGVATITVPEEASAKKTSDYTYVSTKINGKKVDVKAKTIKKDGIYFVHSTEILNKLGVKSSFNSTTKTLKVKNGSKTITIKKGSKYAYEGKKKYTLPATLKNINGRLYVPHDIISKVTNYKTKISSNTLVITKKVSLGDVNNGGNNGNATYVNHKNIPAKSKAIYNVKAPNKTLGNSYGEKDVADFNKLNKLLNPFVDKALEYAETSLGDNSPEMTAFNDFYNKGVKYNPKELSRDERADPYIESILDVQDTVGVLKKEGVSSKIAKKAYKQSLIGDYFSYTVLGYMERNGYDSGKINNSNDSLYGFITGKGGNCRTDAQLVMYMQNKLGNETIGIPNSKFTHVTTAMKIDGTWLMNGSGGLIGLLEFDGNELYNMDAHY